MNFILIMSDTLRPDYMGPYGNDWVKTPNADEFAESAMVFDQAYCGSWATIPNRTDIITGRYGEPIHPWLPLSYSETTFPDLLKSAGYVTQLICDTPHLVQGGHNFDYPFHAWEYIRGQEVDHYGLDHDPIEFPFKDDSKINKSLMNRYFAQYIQNVRGRRTEKDWATYQTYQSAINWLERNYKQEKFCLWIDGFDPHEPPWPPQHYVDMYDPGYQGDQFMTFINAPKLTDAELNHLRARYAGTITFLDRCFGRLMQRLDDLGLAEDTCVMWVSDHGTHVGEHGKAMGKNYAFDEVAKIVTMVRLPKSASVGTRSNDMVQPADYAPTILELAGVEIPQCMQGISFAPALQGKPFETRKTAITSNARRKEKQYPDWFFGARDGRWTLNAYPDKSRSVLFDMEADPGQLTNVAADHPDVVDRLQNDVLEFIRTHDAQPQLVRFFETGDPNEMKDYVAVRPGFEDFSTYFSRTLNRNVLPE